MGEGPGAILNFKTFLSFIKRLLLSHSVMSDSLQPIVGSPPGSPVPGILQARTLEWVAISFSKQTASDYITSSWRLAGDTLLLSSDAYVRSFLYLLYTLIKLYYTKALSDQALFLVPDWILLLRGPRIPVSLHDSTTTFQACVYVEHFLTLL